MQIHLTITMKIMVYHLNNFTFKSIRNFVLNKLFLTVYYNILVGLFFFNIIIGQTMNSIKSIHDINIKNITGEIISMKRYKGKKILIVNVASKCGYTSQYNDLQELHSNYSDKIEVLAIPCNDFGRQEPGTNSEIDEFCKTNFGVTFSVMAKGNIKQSPKHVLYEWLSDPSKNGWNSELPSWNFSKYLIDEKGNLLEFFPSNISPTSDIIVSKL